MMARVERRPEGGGRLYVSIKKDDVAAFEQAATELASARGISVSQLIVKQMLAEYKKLQKQRQKGT